MIYRRMPIEIEAPEELGYEQINYNLSESSYRDRKISEILTAPLDDLLLPYSDHRGHLPLRRLICENSEILNPEHVLVCQSAAMSLFVIHQSILQPGDEIMIVQPNYGTSIETPRGIGCKITSIEVGFDNGFLPDIEFIKKNINKNTKIISLTQPHNPSGVSVSDEIINQIIDLAAQFGTYVLIDETYRELNFQTDLKPYWAEKYNHVISVSSLSKSYGLPGLRIGWIICKNMDLQHRFLATKEQIIICNSILDETLATKALERRTQLLAESHKQLKQNFAVLKEWINLSQYLEWIEPSSGAVAFPRFKPEISINTETFYKLLFQKYKTMVGPGHWFMMPDTYLRIGFGYPDTPELIQGLKNIDLAVAESIVDPAPYSLL